MRIPIITESGWQIDAILETTYVATKEGESVTLEADTLEQIELLIALREGSVKHEDRPRLGKQCGALKRVEHPWWEQRKRLKGNC